MTRIIIALILGSITFSSCNRGAKAPVMATEAETANAMPAPQIDAGNSHAGRVEVGKEDINLEHQKGFISIADLFSDMESYEGKTVKVQAKVVKVNQQIMNRNWIHLQDGTEYDGKFDLTITSDHEFSVGSIVAVKGKIVLDKDFGFGYSYDILMEEAVIVN